MSLQHDESLEAWVIPLCRLITERTGIVIHDHQISGLHDTVKKACQQFGYKDPNGFYNALFKNTGLSPEIEFLVAEITVGESYFFRDPAQMVLLRDELLPEIISRKRLAQDLTLRIWSAGCSSGQELYTVAILLKELLPDMDRWTIHLLGTDISTKALAQANKAIYSTWSFRSSTPPAIKKYFTVVDNHYVVDNFLQKYAKFSYLNLSDDVYPSILTETYAMDLILCRNVLIYIEPAITLQIMSRFSECLVTEGVLLTGPSDHIDGSIPMFKRIQQSESAYYRKTEPIISLLPEPTVSLFSRSIRSEKDDRPSLKSNIKPLASLVSNAGLSSMHQLNERLSELLKLGRWHEVLLVVEQGINKFGLSGSLLQMKAKAQANLGQMKEAITSCELSLEKDPTDKSTYLIQGMVMMEQDSLPEAQTAFRKAIYLDHQFLEAHYQLALLLLRLGKDDLAMKSFHNVLVLAEKSDPTTDMENVPGMSHALFAEMLRKELELYKIGGLDWTKSNDDKGAI
jgi:chemotaxis protein methyltransferase CheR